MRQRLLRARVLWTSLVACCLRAGSCGLFPLDQAYPQLVSEQTALAWPDGGAAYLVASSGLVRVNLRGVQSRGAGVHLRDLPTLGWRSLACNVSAYALCRSAAGDVFPSSAPRVGELFREEALPGGWEEGLGCSNSRGKVVTAERVYDVSACDVLDEGLDVVYSRGRVYQRRSGLGAPVYWVLVVLGVLLIRALSYNIKALAGHAAQGDLAGGVNKALAGHAAPGESGPDKGAAAAQWPALAWTTLAWCILVAEGDGVYATVEDALCFWFCVAYVALYVAYHASLLAAADPAGEPPIFNVLVGTLQLIVCRLFGGALTPYNPVLLVMVGTRMCMKLQAMRGDSYVRRCTICLDALWVGIFTEYAFLPDTMYLVPCLLGSYVLSGFV
jgi:hypothetical protein